MTGNYVPKIQFSFDGCYNYKKLKDEGFINDWRYSPEKMKLREQVLVILLKKFGGELKNYIPKYSNQSIFECAHDWVSQGNKTSHGVVKFFNKNYL